MNVGDFVRQQRKRLGLTQKELADAAGVGLNFVYQLEKNKKTVQLDTTNQVLKALGYKVGVVRDFNPWVHPVATATSSDMTRDIN
ncbi:MAG: helix-turn-helix transcriptional regulator [Pseudobacteriovorax sp.]|nr:helix-turn-helix transcriptional regulator [Pseudobacteriovorax sp.]